MSNAPSQLRNNGIEENYVISVIIIAKNAQNTIRQTMQSLLNQSHSLDEILVVVDSLSDSTVKAVRDFPVKVLHNEGVGYGMARATGVNGSAGNIILFIDADCIADEHWVERIVEVFSISGVLAQAGRVVSIKSLCEKQNTSLKKSSDVSLSFAPTMNFAVKKELIDLIGNFDPAFTRGGEDLDFCIRLRKAGYKLYYNSGAQIFHVTHGYTIRRAWRDGRSRSQAFLKHKKSMKTDLLLTFFHVFSFLAVAILAVAGYVLLATLALGPSVFHRFYRAYNGVKHGGTVADSLRNSFTAYFSYLSLFIHLVASITGLSQIDATPKARSRMDAKW